MHMHMQDPSRDPGLRQFLAQIAIHFTPEPARPFGISALLSGRGPAVPEVSIHNFVMWKH